jgi:diaminopimelate epimerase
MTHFPTFDTPASGRFFIKMHGLRNHFVIVDGRTESYSPGSEEIIRICDPQTGVGGDQLIVIENPREAASNDNADAFMRILNVDGREVGACGNATRCVAWLLLEEAGSDRVVIETLAGLIECRRTGDMEVSCVMGRVSMAWQEIPLAEEKDTCHIDLAVGPLVDGIALNIGNPHIVFFVDDADAVDICSLAPAIQKNELFPDEVNVGVAEMLSEDHIRSVVYERGAGLTTACGSGACVAAYAALARGLTKKRKLTVSMPAGDVLIAIDDDGVATMTGPVSFCFTGNL